LVFAVGSVQGLDGAVANAGMGDHLVVGSAYCCR
jgi:hypothetical protein